MKHYTVARYFYIHLIALLVYSSTAARAATLYQLEWQSDQPLDAASIQATVTGGSLVAIWVAQGGQQGWIDATAPRACLTIDMEAHTVGGALVHIVRSWDADCNKVVAFGDSITAGWKVQTSWAALYASQRGALLDNRAANSLTVAQMVERIAAYDGGAGEALWLVCANDLYFKTDAATFAAGVQAGVDLLRERGIKARLNSSCPPFPRREQAGLVEAYNAALASITGAELIPLPDMPSFMFPDGTHPDEVGHMWLAFAYLGRSWRVWMPQV